MATNGEDVKKNVQILKRAMGIRGEVKPGDLTMKAREIMAKPVKKKAPANKIPPLHTKRGVAVRGLI